MTANRLQALLAAMGNCRCAVLGDFALDVYYDVDQATGEVSLETGKAVHYAHALRCSPGAAGTVAANLCALGARVRVCGVVGDDPHGRELRRGLSGLGAETAELLVQSAGWETPAYVKPLLAGVEQHRLDFGTGNVVAQPVATELADRLAAVAPALDLLIINQQLNRPLLTAALRARIEDLAQQLPRLLVVADCRDGGCLPQGVAIKRNVSELAAWLGRGLEETDAAGCLDAVRAASQRAGNLVVLTRGASGVMAATGNETAGVPGIALSGPTDPVGAGDACLAGFGLARAAGGNLTESLALGNLAAAVTTAKCNQTGTASPAEVLALAAQADIR